MKLGFLSLPYVGHLNPMTALARRMQSRGHEVVFIGVPDVEPFALAAELPFLSFCGEEFPTGSITKVFGPAAKLHGLEVSRWSVRAAAPDLFKAASKHLPQKLAEAGVDALVIDAIYTFVELVPMSLGIPYAQIWNVLHVDLSGATPPCHFSWPNEATPEAWARNIEGAKSVFEIFAQVLPVAMSYAEEVGLQIDWSNPSATTSKLAVITQTPKEFDFSGAPWPAQFHYAGPFHDSDGRQAIPFPWDQLGANPIVYASMGTLLNGLEHVYKTILGVFEKLPEIQLVFSIGTNIDPNDLGPIPSNAIIVRTAPQIELLKRATLCVTHAGLNTALESLSQGVPMVAIPIGYDQPGVAARIAHHGVGEFVELQDLTIEHLGGVIQKVMENPVYRDKARYFRKVIAETNGLDVAADAIECAFEKNLLASCSDDRCVAKTDGEV